MRTFRHRIWCVALISFHSAHSLSSVPQHQPVLAGDWADAKAALRNPECCVVSVSGLGPHLRSLKERWDAGPDNLDLRARVRVRSSASDDCLRVSRAVLPSAPGDGDDPCVAALSELARGVASLADGPLEDVCEDVFVRIVCASDYRARDPMFHTDKAPLRGYVTLRGPGTDFMTRPSTPMEYLTLRGLGAGEPAKSIRRAGELEFIVMKGDHYEAPSPAATPWLKGLWRRASACVHRSPPAAGTVRRRVIVSLDLADGDDDREWYQANMKRTWRSGMTQRKSNLVA